MYGFVVLNENEIHFTKSISVPLFEDLSVFEKDPHLEEIRIQKSSAFRGDLHSENIQIQKRSALRGDPYLVETLVHQVIYSFCRLIKQLKQFCDIHRIGKHIKVSSGLI